jgi:hypothetical protein
MGGRDYLTANPSLEVFQIRNRTLLESFLNHHSILMDRIQNEPLLFAKKGWKFAADRKELREWVYHRYEEMVSAFGWNTRSTDVPIVPCFRVVTVQEAATGIKSGFGGLGDRAGHFGSGVYFDCNISQLQGASSFFVCLVSTGNAYPVVEGLDDEKTLFKLPIKPGSQSHFVAVKADGNVITDEDVASKIEYCRKIVVPQETQAIPLYLVEIGKT